MNTSLLDQSYSSVFYDLLSDLIRDRGNRRKRQDLKIEKHCKSIQRLEIEILNRLDKVVWVN